MRMGLVAIFGASWIICGLATFGILRNDNVNRAHKMKILAFQIKPLALKHDTYRLFHDYALSSCREHTSGDEWILSTSGPVGLIIFLQERGIIKGSLPLGFKLRIPTYLKEDGFPLQIIDNRSK